jgi:hypothetical protein
MFAICPVSQMICQGLLQGIAGGILFTPSVSSAFPLLSFTILLKPLNCSDGALVPQKARYRNRSHWCRCRSWGYAFSNISPSPTYPLHRHCFPDHVLPPVPDDRVREVRMHSGIHMPGSPHILYSADQTTPPAPQGFRQALG